MALPSQLKKIFKIIGGIIIFFTLPTLLLYGFVYFKYNEPLPTGVEGKKADELAYNMLSALNDVAYKNTDYLEWSFSGRHYYKWYKTQQNCEVSWDKITVILDLKNHDNSTVFVAGEAYNGIEKHDYIHKAKGYFNNDSFWLVAPYKVFDSGVKRSIVTTEDNKKALLVTYTSGGSTPGDSYLWHLDDTYKPVSFQMWVEILPIKGLEASWSDWTQTESAAQLPTFHKLLILGIELTDIKGLNLSDI